METTQDGSHDSGEQRRKAMGLKEKYMIRCDRGRFPKHQLNQIDVFFLDDFMFCNSSKLETVGRQAERKSSPIKSNYEFSLALPSTPLQVRMRDE